MSKRIAHIGRRDFLKYSAASLSLLVSSVGSAAINVMAVRVWPARDYTRVTIECPQAVSFNQFIVKDPERLVVDLEGVELNSVLQNLNGKLSASDPYIKLIRAGRFKPTTVRLVIELKAEVIPQIFTLKPVGTYGYRLVMDLYPAQPEDPLLALLRSLPGENDSGGRKAQAESMPLPEATPEMEKNTSKTGKAKTGQGGKSEDPLPQEKIGGKTESAPGTHSASSEANRRGKPAVTRMVTVVIDPGHGGEDPGAVGQGGSLEKDVTLEVSQRLKVLMDRDPNMRTLLTREDDYFIPLKQRVVKARKVQADLFVSIHADAFVKDTARGSSVFVLSENSASSAAARWLAQNENNSDLVGGVNVNTSDPYLARTLLDLSQTATLADSLKLGKAVLAQLGGVNTLHRGQVEQAGFAVLKAPDIPSILVETAFISNPEEEKRLTNPAYQDKIARAILKGIKQYLTANPPPPKSAIS